MSDEVLKQAMELVNQLNNSFRGRRWHFIRPAAESGVFELVQSGIKGSPDVVHAKGTQREILQCVQCFFRGVSYGFEEAQLRAGAAKLREAAIRSGVGRPSDMG